jgi:hypothetical protein
VTDVSARVPRAPENRGYAFPQVVPEVPAAAPFVRAAAVAASASSYELPVRSRTLVDQNNLPCCVSCALGAAMEVMSRGGPTLSPLFHYYVARFDDGGADLDGFLYLDKALKTLSSTGICRSDLHVVPYTEPGSRAKPSSVAYADGSERRLARRGPRRRYEPADGTSNAAWLREQLRQNRPCIIGFRLPEGYEAGTFLNRKFEWLDPERALTAGGHCVLATGYSDLRQAIHIQDSRGTSRYERGRWWMGYRVADSRAVQELYCLIP